MPSSQPLPPSCQWFPALVAAADRRSAPRLAWLLVGAVLARGRRTVTSCIRAAGLPGEYRPCYTAVAAAGKQADGIAARLAHAAVGPLVAGAERPTFALDDTPTPRYGRRVRGAGVHHDPTPGPAGGPFVYGHVWVVLAYSPPTRPGASAPCRCRRGCTSAGRTWGASPRRTGRRSAPSPRWPSNWWGGRSAGSGSWASLCGW